MARALTRLTLAAPWGARAVRSALRIRRDECPRDHRGDAEQGGDDVRGGDAEDPPTDRRAEDRAGRTKREDVQGLSLIHISEPTRLGMISYAVFCLKKKK